MPVILCVYCNGCMDVTNPVSDLSKRYSTCDGCATVLAKRLIEDRLVFADDHARILARSAKAGQC
jgi:hypothetical protein